MLVSSLEFSQARFPGMYLKSEDGYLFIVPGSLGRGRISESAKIRKIAKSIGCTSEWHPEREMWCIQKERGINLPSPSPTSSPHSDKPAPSIK